MTTYDELQHVYHRALNVCDPIDYAYRQQNLLFVIANYLIDRDRPPLSQEEFDALDVFRKVIEKEADPKLIE